MTTSNEHERVQKWIGDFMANYLMEIGHEGMPRGQVGQGKVRVKRRSDGAKLDVPTKPTPFWPRT